MHAQLVAHGCVYQDDAVDYIVRRGGEPLLRENSDGNAVLGQDVLKAFRALNDDAAVWVKPERYWRWRVNEDEPGRDARG